MRAGGTKGLLGSGGSFVLRRGFPLTHPFAQARTVFAVATERCREVFAAPGCVTLWQLPASIDEEFAGRWQGWLDETARWQPFFAQIAALRGQAVLGALTTLGLSAAREARMTAELDGVPNDPWLRLDPGSAGRGAGRRPCDTARRGIRQVRAGETHGALCPARTGDRAMSVQGQISTRLTHVGALVEELRTFRDEIARVAPLWHPDLNDGVIINFAPLWRLTPRPRGWQKECRDTWTKLTRGDYDWAHLAMHLWPERVVRKCREDRSLAIAHGLDHQFWLEGADGKWQPRHASDATLEALIAERTSVAVQDTLARLQDAPIEVVATKRAVKQERPAAKPKRARKGQGAEQMALRLDTTD